MWTRSEMIKLRFIRCDSIASFKLNEITNDYTTGGKNKDNFTKIIKLRSGTFIDGV
jgi:hypothetical protein